MLWPKRDFFIGSFKQIATCAGSKGFNKLETCL